MDTYEAELSKLRLIAQARQILNDEFVQRRADEYAAWLTKTKDAWKTPTTSIPYPPFISSPSLSSFQSSIGFPSEQDIVNKALELYNESVVPAPAPVPTSVPPPAVAVSEPTTIVPEPQVVDAVIVEPTPPPTVTQPLPAVTKSIADIFADRVEQEPSPQSTVPELQPRLTEALQRISPPGKILPGIYEKLQQIQADFGNPNVPHQDHNND